MGTASIECVNCMKSYVSKTENATHAISGTQTLLFFMLFFKYTVHVTLELRILAFDSEMLLRFRPLLKFDFVYEMCRYGILDQLPLH